MQEELSFDPSFANCVMHSANVSSCFSRLTLLLGPPGCGKTTFLKALSGNLEKNLKVSDFFSFGLLLLQMCESCIIFSPLFSTVLW